jgi:predicted nucleotidyltransferase
MLATLLAAADYRPSLALEQHREAVLAAARRHGLERVRAFGSVTTGRDRHDSDIDLLVDAPEGFGLFALGAFVGEVEEITGFPVDIVLDRGESPYLDRIRQEAVPL